ncbi:hypothetical protein EVAR_51604_1 [Eumeta japonica]|uniref:Uncharacterized protein n=1 Tax=Eumeta variegata TaxID=151549 RepID=A0A4C1YBJ9_EUMVA|nr:hypothetical protein EVAR_51604_1 [Eumeta japonica]
MHPRPRKYFKQIFITNFRPRLRLRGRRMNSFTFVSIDHTVKQDPDLGLALDFDRNHAHSFDLGYGLKLNSTEIAPEQRNLHTLSTESTRTAARLFY